MSDRQDEERRARAERGVAASFAISAIASIGFAISYVVADAPQVEGALLAVAMGGLGYGFIRWARSLMPGGPFEQERRSYAQPEKIERDTETALAQVPRRRFLGRMLAAALGALGLASLFPIRSLGPGPGDELFRTAWTPGARLVDPEGRLVTIDTLDVGGVITVFPEGFVNAADSQTLLIRVDTDAVTTVEGREDWAPVGHIAYSKICTHAGCPVGLYESESQRLFCPCHQSAFDVLKAAQPVSGPAPRPLPQLPLDVDGEGHLVARSDFLDPVGPGFWTAPDA